MQAGVLERDDSLRGERVRDAALLWAKSRAPKGERPEAGLSCEERKLKQFVGFVRLTDLNDFATLVRELAACGAGRLDCNLEEDAEELVGVVGRGERRPDLVDRRAQPGALGRELVESRFELI